MENENQDFEQLKKLLALKKYESPPPGYFNSFSRRVISKIREDHCKCASEVDRLDADAPWLLRLWRSLQLKPAFAGAFGAAVCALILGGVFLAEKPGKSPDFIRSGTADAAVNPIMGGASITAGLGSYQPGLMASTNSGDAASKNLFEVIPPGQTLPAGFSPNGN